MFLFFEESSLKKINNRIRKKKSLNAHLMLRNYNNTTQHTNIYSILVAYLIYIFLIKNTLTNN